MGGIGMGMQYSAQKQAASQAAGIARYNYAVQSQNIRQQQALAEWSAAAQAKQANANAAIVKMTAETNAVNLENQAQAGLNRGIEEQRRSREDMLRFQATQRARIAKSGVAAAGTPIEVLAESARDLRLSLNDKWYETNTDRDSLLWGAKMERYSGEVGAANYGMEAGMARAEGALAPIRARMAMREARFGLASGMNQSAGMRSAATAGLVSGAGTLLSQGYSMYQTTPRPYTSKNNLPPAYAA